MNVEEGDQLAWVAGTSGQNEILLVTRQGKAIRFSEDEVRPMGLSAAGVLAIRLSTDDGVVGMGIISEDAFVVTVSEKGYAKRTAIKNFPLQKRYGGGVQAAKLTSRTGPLAVAGLASEQDDIVLATSTGRVIKLPVQTIHSQGRAASGSNSRSDTKEPYLEPGVQGAPAVLTVLAGTKAAAKRPSARKAGKKTPRPKASTAEKSSAEPVKGESTPPAEASPSSDSSQATAKSQPTTKTASSSRKATSRSRTMQDKSASAKTSDAEAEVLDRAESSKAEAATQMALPLVSAPSKKSPKMTTRKKKTVRSVPRS
jgi:hypothetical protein